MMKRFLCALLALILAGPLAGCGTDRDKGVNKDRDKPREAPPEGK